MGRCIQETLSVASLPQLLGRSCKLAVRTNSAGQKVSHSCDNERQALHRKISPMPISIPFPTKLEILFQESHIIKVNVLVSAKGLSPTIERQSVEKSWRQTLTSFETYLSFLVTLLFKPQNHSLEGTGRHNAGSQGDYVTLLFKTFTKQWLGQYTRTWLNFHLTVSHGTPLICIISVFSIHKNKFNKK